MIKSQNPKRVLIVGFFSNPAIAPLTQAVELASLLRGIGYDVLITSRYRNRFLRLTDIVWTICKSYKQFDVAILQFYSGKSLIWQYIAAFLIKILNKKLIVTIHGGAVPERMEQSPWPYLAVLKKADIITCPSPFMMDRLSKYNLNIRLVENSLHLKDYPFFNKKELKPVLLWMRAFSPIYNPLMAVYVVKELKKIYPSVKMFMGGPDMGMLHQVRQLIKSEQLGNQVEIVGYMDLEAKKEFAAKSGIYISTNRIDNAPVTFIEMWAMGLPIVSTNVGGVPYLAEDRVTALLTDNDDDVAMADKINDLLSNKDLAQQLISNGREQAKNYEREFVAKKWNQLLNTI